MQHALVLLGAGASRDSDSDAATCKEEFRPPLTSELFNIKQRPAFEPFLANYRGAKVLAPGLAEKSKFDTFSLEKELRRLAEHKDGRVKRHFHDIPRYLNELFITISVEFTRFPGAYIRLAQGLLAEHPHRVFFISLNYDNLLEQALGMFDPDLKYMNIGHYCLTDRQALVIKPHGSIYWYIELEDKVRGLYIPVPRKPWKILLKTSIREGDAFSRYPILTAPMASKAQEEFACPPDHISCFKKEGHAIRKVLFIGTSCLDTDVLTLISESVKYITIFHVVVCGDKEEVEKRVKDYFPALESTRFEIFNEGFRKYLDSNDFEGFCRAEP